MVKSKKKQNQGKEHGNGLLLQGHAHFFPTLFVMYSTLFLYAVTGRQAG